MGKILLIPAYIDEDYYDIQSNRMYIRGQESNQKVCVKMMRFPNTLDNLFTISEKGLIYSIMNDEYVRWGYRNGKPFINIPIRDKDKYVLSSINVIDLIAYNFIRDSDSYIERGYIPVTLNRNNTDLYYSNIVYALPSEV